jgi:glycosyltransferase involved in cell wall biosynthesis
LALERQGFEVVRIALRGWDDELADPEDRKERERTSYVLALSAVSLLRCFLRVLFTRPLSLARAIFMTCRLSWHAERSLPFHVAYLLEACVVQCWLDDKAVEHLHAHFGTNSAEVAMLANILGKVSWSFTVHGPEEFDKAPLIGLAAKVRHCSFVVAISSFGRSQLFRLVDRNQWHKVHVVHCGIDGIFQNIPLREVPAVPRLVCVGRLCEQKGQLLLVEAARVLAKRGAKFELVFAGDGEMRKEVERLLAKYALNERVRITGWISGEGVRDEILGSRALVLPSFAEGLPVVIMEAMAARRPVISTYVGGIPELVKDGQHGWLVPAGDVEALSTAIQTCLGTPIETLRKMGEAARVECIKRHDVEIQVQRLAALFRAAGRGGGMFNVEHDGAGLYS